MQFRHLGKSGLFVSAIGLGTNQFGGKVDAKLAAEIIHAAVDAGVNFIDTADVYREGRSESFIGAAIQGLRENVLVATKVRHPVAPNGPNDRGASRHHILSGAEASLRRLGTETIDLYQIHSWDDETPIEETMRALDDLVRSGKVRYIGASNFTAWQLTQANAVAEMHNWTSFISIQPHYHMLHREVETELLAACKYFNVGVLPYFPLAGGFLTGKYRRGQGAPKGSRGEESPYVQKYMTEENYTILEKLGAFSQERGRGLNELAIAWLLAQPQVSSVIAGAAEVEHVQANVKAGEWVLTAEDISAVAQILGDKGK
jgi:aryl-alcohol dehydrogenase-like predicted oxidoreductase